MKRTMFIMIGIPLLLLASCEGSSSTSISNSSQSSSNEIETNKSEEGLTLESTYIDYGKLSIPSFTVYAKYKGKTPSPVFSKPEYAEEIEYDFDSDAIVCDENIFTCRVINKTVNVIATTPHLTTTFNVYTKEFDYESQVVSRENSWKSSGSPNNDTLFIGDSFFDTQFWSNFYTTYEGKDTRTVGISATTTTDWEMFNERLLYPVKPNNIVIHCGTNNVFDDKKDDKTTISDTKRLIESIHAELPLAHIYYFGIEPRTYAAGSLSLETTLKLLNNINTQIKEFISELTYITYLDSPAYFYNEDKTVNASMFRDGVHPALENYSIYTNLLLEAGLDIKNK